MTNRVLIHGIYGSSTVSLPTVGTSSTTTVDCEPHRSTGCIGSKGKCHVAFGNILNYQIERMSVLSFVASSGENMGCKQTENKLILSSFPMY